MEDYETIKQQVKQAIAKIAKVKPEELGEEDDFINTLDIDSLSRLETIFTIEKKFNIEIPDQEMDSLRNLKDVYNYMEKFINKEN